MAKRIFFTLIFLLLLLGSIFGAWGWQIYQAMQQFSNFAPPPISVATSQAKKQAWQTRLTAIGTLEAIQGISITPETSGVIKSVAIKSGMEVKTGQLLFQLDDRMDIADLNRANADLKLAKIHYQRIKDLAKSQATPLSEVDKATANLQRSEAMVKKLKARLDQKHITAPFSGQLGILNVNEGQFVSPATTPRLITLQKLDPLYIRFTVPEQHLAKIKLGQPLKLRVDGDQTNAVNATISAIDPQVNPETHNITIQGTLENPDKTRFPGQFVEVEIIFPQKDTVLAIPQSAITYNLYGDIVYVVKQNSNQTIAHRRYVKLGKKNGKLVSVMRGLEPGEIVITAGHHKILKDKTQVVIDKEARF